MNRLWQASLCLLIFSAAAAAQERLTTIVPQTPSADYSKEPFVIEQYATTARFENDGTGEEDLTVRVRVQSDAGVEQWNKLAVAFNLAREAVDIRSVRVHKSDGKTIDGDVNTAENSSAALGSGFFAYADWTEKHFSVSSLAPGDTLEYEIVKRIIKPAAPGEFWFEHRFLDDAIVQDEQLEINLPAGRKITLKSSATFSYGTQETDGRTIYRWKHLNSRISDDSGKKDAEHARDKSPDVQLSTFASWKDLARWYAKLAQGRTEPSPEIRSKTQELIQGRSSDLEKAQAIYEYVSKNIRYATLPFGAAGYQPRAAAEILSSQYGDSNDQHTLLAAMLQAAGIHSDPVLISSTHNLDTSLPSPSQFDHMITAVPLDKKLIWMDSTAEVAPFRLLAPPLRSKSALVIPPDGSGEIVETPADPPFLSVQQVEHRCQGKRSRQAYGPRALLSARRHRTRAPPRVSPHARNAMEGAWSNDSHARWHPWRSHLREAERPHGDS